MIFHTHRKFKISRNSFELIRPHPSASSAFLKTKAVTLTLVFLITISLHSGNLVAAPSGTKSNEQETMLTKHFDRLLTKARQLQNAGDYKGALAELKEANELANELENIAGVISVLVQRSDIYLNVGRIDQAKTLGQQALEMTVELKDQPKLMASVLNNWGTILTLDRNHEDAIKAFNQGLNLAKKAEEPSLAVLILANLAKTAATMDDLPMAEEALYEGMAFIEQLHSSPRKAILSSALASQLQDLLEEEDHTLSKPSLKEKTWTLWESVKLFAEESANTRLQSNAHGNIGHLCEMEGRYDQALAATRSALFLAQQGAHPEMLYRWQWQLGRLFKKLGQKDKALKTYQQAINSLTPIRTRLMFGYRNSPGYFQKNIKPVYYGLAALHIDAAAETSDINKQQLQLQKARLTIEQMKAAEVEDFFQDECAAAFRNKATSLDNVGVNSAVIYPMPFEDRLVVIATLPSGIVQITSPVDQKTLTQTVIQFRKYLQDSSHQSFAGPGKKLYYWMIGALEETLQEEAIDTLIIIPDGALSMIPFAALYDGENFLIEKYAIVTTPSLQLTDPQPVPRENFEALLVGLSEGVQGFPPLPNVPEELETIGKILQGNSEQLLNQAYEKKALTDAVTQNTYRIIHMATHGEFSADPNETFLLTYDGRLPLNQFGSLLRLGQFSDEPVELLTLSACNTAVGDVRAAFGLAGIALESGARSAVATLWSVHDEATMLAMTDFYKHFQSRPDLNKAQALQAAQLNLLNQPQYKHPAYWSPFLFIGNWL